MRVFVCLSVDGCAAIHRCCVGVLEFYVPNCMCVFVFVSVFVSLPVCVQVDSSGSARFLCCFPFSFPSCAPLPLCSLAHDPLLVQKTQHHEQNDRRKRELG